METLVNSTTETRAKVCVHCGAEVGPARAGDPRFCCQGCKRVHELIQTRGLTRASDSGERLDFLDDPQFLSLYASGDPDSLDFYVEGAHCAACVWLLERLPEFVEGIRSVRLDLSNSVATVKRETGGSFARVAAEMGRLGYPAFPVLLEEARIARARENRAHLLRLGVAGACAGNIMLLAVGLYAGADGHFEKLFTWASFALFLPVLLYCATPFYSNAWRALRAGRVSIDLPIVLGLWFGAIVSILSILGVSGGVPGVSGIYFDSLSGLIFLLLGGRYLLKRVQTQALDSSRLARFLTPARARRWDPARSRFVEMPAEALQLGDLIRVLPGECLPADAVLVSGQGSISTAFLSGEPKPFQVEPGARLLAGSQNHSKPLDLKVAALGAETRLGRILKETGESLARRAPISRFADQVGQWFVIATLILVAAGFYLGWPAGIGAAVNRALAVAIVVCPCFFALSIPIVMGRTLSRLARAGILVKGPDVLEKLAQVRSVVFDKTGTLTEGHLEVSQWTCDSQERVEIERATLALESLSAHPIAQALCRHLTLPPNLVPSLVMTPEEFSERPGIGVSGRIQGHSYEIQADLAQGRGVAVYRDGVPVAHANFEDRLRVESYAAVRALQALGIEISILSGDGVAKVNEVALALGISPAPCRGGASPEEKAQAIAATPHCMMVGDGANDATALAQAHVGVAVRGGMEISLRASDIYAGTQGLLSIAPLVVAGRESLRVIRRSLGFSLLYNTIAISVALSGSLTPLFAAILMPLSTLTVLGISLAGTSKLRRALAEVTP